MTIWPYSHKANGWLALSPLAVFLIVYLATSLAAGDFYKVPVASAFLIAAIYAVLTARGSLEERVSTFSKGAADKNVLLMIWIFVMAGAFAGSAKEIGAIDSTVNATLMILPGQLLLFGLFVAACFVSMAMGTSVGTIVALVPIASGIAGQSGASLPLTTAVIVGGAFFGDNLSFISDTTIASTRTQGCSMADKFKANIWVAGPAAVITAALYIVMGHGMTGAPEIGQVEWLKLIPYLSIIVLSLTGMNVLSVLSIGIALNAAIGLGTGATGWTGFLGSIGSGIAGMGDLIIVTMLAGGMLELIKEGGGLDLIIRGLTKGIRGKRGAELSIAATVSLANLCTANNTIAIITTGSIARKITERYGLDPRKTASILDTFSCIVQCVIPYGAQLLMASGLAGIPAAAIIAHLHYPLILLLVSLLSILLRLPRRYSGV